ncbi:MAG TPA: hypothetical protein DHV59_15270 [Oxalobacteraceae bacterium]|nr:hypothetical protein [Oxalobacteraceae bacterium]
MSFPKGVRKVTQLHSCLIKVQWWTLKFVVKQNINAIFMEWIKSREQDDAILSLVKKDNARIDAFV